MIKTVALSARHYREVQHRDGSIENKVAPMRKTIYSLYLLAKILRVASNHRYLEFVSTFDYCSDGTKNLDIICEPVRAEDRTYRGFNFFSKIDQKLLRNSDAGRV